MNVIQILCIFGLIYATSGAQLPSFFNKCKRSDPELNQCAISSANNGWQEFIKGDKKLKVPVLNPFKIDKVQLQASASLSVKFTDVSVIGFQGAVIKDISINQNQKHWTIKVFLPLVEILATYNMNGQILVLPIRGNGPAKLTSTNVNAVYDFDYELITKKGKEYLKLVNPKINLKEEKMQFQFDNLFNGDKQLGAEMNRFLNENSVNVADEVRPALSEVVSSIATSIANNYFDRIPYNGLFAE